MFGRGVRLTALGGLASAAFVHTSNNNYSNSNNSNSGLFNSFNNVQPQQQLYTDNAGTGMMFLRSCVIYCMINIFCANIICILFSLLHKFPLKPAGFLRSVSSILKISRDRDLERGFNFLPFSKDLLI